MGNIFLDDEPKKTLLKRSLTSINNNPEDRLPTLDTLREVSSKVGYTSMINVFTNQIMDNGANTFVLEKNISLKEDEILKAITNQGYSIIVYLDRYYNDEYYFIVKCHDGFKTYVYGYISIFDNNDYNKIEFFGDNELYNVINTLPIYDVFSIYRIYDYVDNGGYAISDNEKKISSTSKYVASSYNEKIPNPNVLLTEWLVSKAKVMLLYGDPGTGKSSYVLQMISNHKGRIYLVDKHSVLTRPAFIDYIAALPDNSIVVIEDADMFLMERKEGNDQMSSLLNLTSGIAERNIRFIFITNLEKLSDIDDGLLRPGRLYKNIHFKPHHRNNVQNVRLGLGMSLVSDEYLHSKEHFTLAEIVFYEDGKTQFKKTSFGFNS